jgi:hypothetical protein
MPFWVKFLSIASSADNFDTIQCNLTLLEVEIWCMVSVNGCSNQWLFDMGRKFVVERRREERTCSVGCRERKREGESLEIMRQTLEYVD